ncbi:AEC family transporter [Parasedimentitalea psychrophila]|uniref:AEC family transporter n=1 Tax=Parasedimentitalea psychrophila TaxID=2997337 RepID=A0A9Y2L3C5_9RHOB|nr:AEC family transporter [Parasedimentitalea psychrophila]WIY26916.1 AEC family transporter [Parasedimentitalea psychrophila]
MATILAITFPIYATIGLGYLIVYKGWFSAAEMRSFGQYVMNIALPALLFNAVSSRDISDIFQPDYMLVYGLGGLATIGFSYALFSLGNLDPKRRALGVMGSTCPNSAFIGFPIMLLLFPDLASSVLTLNFLVETLLLVPICLVLMELADSDNTQPAYQQFGTALLKLLRMPLMIGLLLGLAASLIDLSLPAPVGRFIQMLAASAGALSLVVIGGSLVGLPLHGNRSLAAQITGIKLILHPALVGLAVIILTFFGLIQLSPEMRSAVIISAAMPMFGSYTVFAQKLKLQGAASLAVLGATTGAFVTLSLFLLWLT